MLERVMGIEPTFEAWEAPVLPLNYTRFRDDAEIKVPRCTEFLFVVFVAASGA